MYNIVETELAPGIPKIEVHALENIAFGGMERWMKSVIRELRQDQLKDKIKFIVEFYQPNPPDYHFGLASCGDSGLTYTWMP